MTSEWGTYHGCLSWDAEGGVRRRMPRVKAGTMRSMHPTDRPGGSPLRIRVVLDTEAWLGQAWDAKKEAIHALPRHSGE